MEEFLVGDFDKWIDYDYDEQNLNTLELDEIKKKHEEWLFFLKAQWGSLST